MLIVVHPATVDIRKELAVIGRPSAKPMLVEVSADGASAPSRDAPSLDLLRAGDVVHAVRHRPLRPDDLHLHPVVPGRPRRRWSSRCADLSLHWFVELFTQVRTGDVIGAFSRSIPLAVMVIVLTVRDLGHGRLRLPPALSRVDSVGLLPGDRQPGRARPGARHRRRSDPSTCSASRPAGTPRRSARNCPGRCRSAC